MSEENNVSPRIRYERLCRNRKSGPVELGYIWRISQAATYCNPLQHGHR